MNPLITILARSGSKGLPGKAIKKLLGKPLICWTVEQAREWGKAYTVVSTDDQTIGRTASNGFFKGSIIYRPKKLAKDDTPKMDATRHVVKHIERRKGKPFNPIIDLDITNPCRRVKDIERVFAIFVKKQPKTIISVTKAKKSPYMNQVMKLAYSVCTPIEMETGEDRVYTRRQDTPNVYDVNCCIYCYDRKFLLNEKNMTPIADKTEIYVMPQWSNIDIDDEVDFVDVENRMKKYVRKRNRQ